MKTNVPFLENLLRHPEFQSGGVHTRRRRLSTTRRQLSGTQALSRAATAATKILSYLGDVEVVNSRPDVKGKLDPKKELLEPRHPAGAGRRQKVPAGHGDKLLEMGPEKFCEWVRKQKPLLLTDTTFRDAHQSLLATRVRTHDLLTIADAVAHRCAGLFSLEMWGGATFDTTMRFLQEDPWDRLGQLRTRIPNIPFQMLLRASNAVGYTNYPDNVVTEFVKASAQHGIDVFRVFDSLNWMENMKVAVAAVREHTSSICEAAICYTGDILDPKRTKYSIQYYVKLAKEDWLQALGTHVLGIKDRIGRSLCKPYAAQAAAGEELLRDEVDVPIRLPHARHQRH